MSRICKHCGLAVKDEIKICPKCGTIGFFDMPPTELSHLQVLEVTDIVAANVLKSWKFRITVIVSVSLLMAALLSLIGLIINFNIHDQVARLFEPLYIDTSNKLSAAHVAITNQIVSEFETPRIQEVIESVASGQSKEILERKVQPAVDAFRNEAALVRTAARAQAFDFDAYKTLLKLRNGTNDDSKFAKQVIEEIDRILELDQTNPMRSRRFAIVANGNLYGGPFTTDEFADFLRPDRIPSVAVNREALVSSVMEMHNVLFLGSLMGLLTKETDLIIADRIARAIGDITKQDFRPGDYDQIEVWWSTNQTHYTNWPIEAFSNGLTNIFHGQYSEAVTNFEKVLAIDPLAEETRTFAIMAGLEIGNTNKAFQLNSGFSNTNSRWASYAGAFFELHQGNISNATVRFAEVITNNQFMPLQPREQSHMWRNLDWPLYRKLIPKDF